MAFSLWAGASASAPPPTSRPFPTRPRTCSVLFRDRHRHSSTSASAAGRWRTLAASLAASQPTPTAKTADATLTIAELLTRIVTATKAVGGCPDPSDRHADGCRRSAARSRSISFEWGVINLGSSSGAVTMTAAPATPTSALRWWRLRPRPVPHPQDRGEHLRHLSDHPALIQPGVGLTDPTTSGDAGPCLKSTLSGLIALNAGCTIVCTFNINTQNSSFRCYLFDLPGFNNSFTAGVTDGPDYNAEVNDGGGAVVTDILPGATKAAFNISIERLAGSLQGRPVFAEDASFDASAFPFTNWAVSVSSNAILESVGWYPLQAEADLPMLSSL
jgi:hypothetical protein